MKLEDIQEAKEKALQVILALTEIAPTIAKLLLEIGTIITIIKVIIESF